MLAVVCTWNSRAASVPYPLRLCMCGTPGWHCPAPSALCMPLCPLVCHPAHYLLRHSARNIMCHSAHNLLCRSVYIERPLLRPPPPCMYRAWLPSRFFTIPHSRCGPAGSCQHAAGARGQGGSRCGAGLGSASVYSCIQHDAGPQQQHGSACPTVCRLVFVWLLGSGLQDCGDHAQHRAMLLCLTWQHHNVIM
jgi:hypothetical protein